MRRDSPRGREISSFHDRLVQLLRSGRFLAVQHNGFLQAAVGILATFLTLATTGKPILTREVFRRIVLRKEFLLGIGRTSWYLRRGWPGINLSRDPMSNFCRDLAPTELFAQRDFLEKRGRRLQPSLVAAEQVFISAALVQQSFGRSGFGAAVEDFAQQADAQLDLMAENPLPDSLQQSADSVHFDFSISEAHAAFRDIAAVLDGLGTRWFVLSGTFLGIVREGDLLPHDHDIDIGLFDGEADLEGVAAAIQANESFSVGRWQRQIQFSKGADGHVRLSAKPVLLKVSHRTGTHIDIFVHFREGETIWHGSSLYRWNNSAFDLSPFQLAGRTVLGPDDPDRYLTENYGTWRIPKVEFNTGLDTTNQEVIASPMATAIFLRRIWALRGKKEAEASRLLRQLEQAGLIAIAPERAGGWRLDTALYMPGAQS